MVGIGSFVLFVSIEFYRPLDLFFDLRFEQCTFVGVLNFTFSGYLEFNKKKALTKLLCMHNRHYTIAEARLEGRTVSMSDYLVNACEGEG